MGTEAGSTEYAHGREYDIEEDFSVPLALRAIRARNMRRSAAVLEVADQTLDTIAGVLDERNRRAGSPPSAPPPERRDVHVEDEVVTLVSPKRKLGMAAIAHTP